MIYIRRPDNKEKGVLLPVFCLPSPYGIGCFSKEAEEFIDWLDETGHTYWQILPLNPPGCADSPYQPLSSFGGNAYFIDPAQLVDQGLLSADELDGYDMGADPGHIDYEALYASRMEMLKLAWTRFAEKVNTGKDAGEAAAYRQFLSENAFWIEEFALFMALREDFDREVSWDAWPQELRRYDPALAETRADTVEFYRWTQFEFFRQWDRLKRYANDKGVKIIGDMPVYVSYDSSDCWANPKQFQLGEDLLPTAVAGVPPDGFSDEGQKWGNPLYDWEYMKERGYSWWVSRIRQCFRMYDVIRLDHFRGYESYYSVDADAENAMHGSWHRGPGMDLFRQLEKDGMEITGRFIAEDLGFLTEEVHKLLRDTGFPGTKVIHFAFDGDPNNLYLPENYGENCVVYTGTHDNDTTVGWFRGLSGDAQAGILQYLGLSGEEAWKLVLEHAAYIEKPDPSGSDAPTDPAILAARLLVEKALASPARLAIIPIQDYLLLGSEARVNVPGTIADNWTWRMPAARSFPPCRRRRGE